MNSENTTKDEKSEQIKSQIVFVNIKSIYILKKIAYIMGKEKLLAIMKYNKKLQKKYDLNINDYKEYIQLFSPIEIDLNLAENKYTKFINISNEKKDYFHIYLDNSNKEINFYYLSKSKKVKTIKIIIDYQVISF